MRAVVGAARMTRLKPRWLVVVSALVASINLSFELLFVLLLDPYPHIVPTSTSTTQQREHKTHTQKDQIYFSIFRYQVSVPI